MRLLVVEDDPKFASIIRRGLRGRAVVDVTDRGEEALWMSKARTYDALVLDVMLPGIDGFETCRRLRAAGVWTPILMLTARRALDDRVTGLDCGADDYLVKPFALEELAARVRALARREPVPRAPIVEVGSLRLDPAARRIWRGDTEIMLTAREFAILEAFMRRPGRVLTRVDLLDLVWEDEYENRSNIVNVYIRSLREKIDRPFGCTSLETVWGSGYRMKAV